MSTDDATILRLMGNANGQALIGLDLKGADLTGFSFVGARLYDIDFRQAILDKCDFTGAIIVNTDMGAAKLRGAKFAEVNCMSVCFDEAALHYVEFIRTKMEDCTVHKADFLTAVFDGAFITDTTFALAFMSQVSFYNSFLTSANFTKTDLKYARMAQNTRIYDSLFSHSNLEHATMHLAYCVSSNFSYANLRGTGITGKFIDCDFRGCSLSGDFQYLLKDCTVLNYPENE